MGFSKVTHEKCDEFTKLREVGIVNYKRRVDGLLNPIAFIESQRIKSRDGGYRRSTPNELSYETAHCIRYRESHMDYPILYFLLKQIMYRIKYYLRILGMGSIEHPLDLVLRKSLPDAFVSINFTKSVVKIRNSIEIQINKNTSVCPPTEIINYFVQMASHKRSRQIIVHPL
jgi:hypothetical protein